MVGKDRREARGIDIGNLHRWPPHSLPVSLVFQVEPGRMSRAHFVDLAFSTRTTAFSVLVHFLRPSTVRDSLLLHLVLTALLP